MVFMMLGSQYFYSDRTYEQYFYFLPLLFYMIILHTIIEAQKRECQNRSSMDGFVRDTAF